MQELSGTISYMVTYSFESRMTYLTLRSTWAVGLERFSFVGPSNCICLGSTGIYVTGTWETRKN